MTAATGVGWLPTVAQQSGQAQWGVHELQWVGGMWVCGYTVENAGPHTHTHTHTHTHITHHTQKNPNGNAIDCPSSLNNNTLQN